MTTSASTSGASASSTCSTKRRLPRTASVAVSGNAAAHSGSSFRRPRRIAAGSSTFPRTAVTGATASSASSTCGPPTSPACTIRSQPSSAASTSGRTSPCVSETSPIRARRRAMLGAQLSMGASSSPLRMKNASP